MKKPSCLLTILFSCVLLPLTGKAEPHVPTRRSVIVSHQQRKNERSQKIADTSTTPSSPTGAPSSSTTTSSGQPSLSIVMDDAEDLKSNKTRYPIDPKIKNAAIETVKNKAESAQ